MLVGLLYENMKESDNFEGLGVIRFPFYLDIHFNIILTSTCNSLKRFLSFTFPHQNPAHISVYFHECHTPSPSYSS
jgi:hypothetical protein